MTLDQRLRDRFTALLKEGEQVLRQHGWPSRDDYHHPDQVDYIRFRTEALNLIRRACGENSDHYRQLQRIAESKDISLNSYYYRDCFAILQAAHRGTDWQNHTAGWGGLYNCAAARRRAAYAGGSSWASDNSVRRNNATLLPTCRLYTCHNGRIF